MNSVFICFAFAQDNLFTKARWVWVARTGKGHAVPGLTHHTPGGPGFMTVHQGSPGAARGQLAEAEPGMTGSEGYVCGQPS